MTFPVTLYMLWKSESGDTFGRKKNNYFFLITIQLLCNYWPRRQGRYFRTVPKPCDSCVSPSVQSSHMLKEQPALPDYNYSKMWSSRGSSCRSLGSKGPLWLRLVQHSPETPLLQPTFSAHWPGLGEHLQSLATLTAFPRANLTEWPQRGWHSCSMTWDFTARELLPFCRVSSKFLLGVEAVQKLAAP